MCCNEDYNPARPIEISPIETGCNNMQAQLYPFHFSIQPSSSLFMGLSAHAGGLVAPQPDLSGGEQLIQVGFCTIVQI